MFKLVVRTGSQAGMEYRLDRSSLRLGRGSGNDIILQDSQASRNHAELRVEGEQVTIQDLGSMNGTLVNNERVVGSRRLQPGDQVRIGDTTLSCELAVMAAPAAPAYWDEGMYTEQEVPPGPAGGKKWLLWALVAAVALLAVAAAVALFFVLKPEPTPTPVVVEQAPTTAPAIVVAPTTAPQVAVQPTAAPLVSVPTVSLAPTVQIQPTVKVEAPAASAKPKTLPTSAPLPPGALEQLPPQVAAFIGSVPPDQLPAALAQQIETLGPEQVQVMIGALFPGITPSSLPAVVAASLPGMSQADLQALLDKAFPGQTIQAPKTGPIGGRMVFHIYNKAAKQDDLYLANASGGQPTFLTDFASEPDFSPDGQWIVYFSWAGDHLGLRLIKPDGSGDTELTSIREHSYPSFSPDGNRITYYNMDSHTLHVINRDGTGERAIGNGEFPAWSPVGDQIAYRGCLSDGKCGLMVANADGSNPRQITTYANDSAPRWSPNGGQIAFHSDRDGNWEIYVINVDGSWLRRITIDPHTDVMPCWSPDGLRIAFRSDRSGAGAVWVTSGIGGGAFKQFDADFDPAWPQYSQMDWVR